MNRSELWLTTQEIKSMLDGRLSWDDAARIADERKLEGQSSQAADAEDSKQAAEVDDNPQRVASVIPESPVKADDSEDAAGGFRLTGLPVFALVGGTGVLVFSLWFYLVTR